jgi:predicted nucleotidyltransferase
MLSPEASQFIRKCAEEFHVRTVWLFGSSLGDENEAHDIDLAVEGLDPDQFFKFYGLLFFGLPKPVDLVDLSENPPLASLIREKGIRVYGQ